MPDEYRGIERSKIPWNPKIDYDKCIHCGTCVDYCKLGAYIIVDEHGEKKPIVKYPNNCVVLCTGCEAQCPVGAISFPSKQKTRKLIKKLEKLQP
jgi:NAD-dependent dihydropyrimidine dehydrogenase PreA subunit